MALLASQVLLHCPPKAGLYNVEMTLGKRIQRARKRLSLTQGDVAAKFGVTDKAVSSWERDETIPDVAKMPELRRVLRVSYVWLLEGDGAPPEPTNARVLMDDLAPAEWAALGAHSASPRPSKRAS